MYINLLLSINTSSLWSVYIYLSYVHEDAGADAKLYIKFAWLYIKYTL